MLFRQKNSLLLVLLSLSLGACASAPRQAGHSIDSPQAAGTPETSTQAGPESKAKRSETRATPPPPVEPARPLFAEVPAGGQLIGKKVPMALEAMSNTGHWVAYCHTKNGSQTMKMTPRGDAKGASSIVLQLSKEKREIDALLAAEESGRHVVTLEGASAWLVDSTTGERFNLDVLKPDLRFDPLADHRSFAFTSRGLTVLSSTDNQGYFLPLPLSDAGKNSTLLKSAHPISFGQTPVWRLFSEQGSISATTTATQASSSWPVAEQKSPTHRCRTGFQSFAAHPKVSAYRPKSDWGHLWLRLPRARGTSSKKKSAKTPSKLQAEQAPGLVMAFDDSWVRRLKEGRLMLVKDGAQRQIASSRCGARILHADYKSGLFLVSCEGYTPIAKKRSRRKRRAPPKYRFDLNLVRPGFVRALRVDVARTGVDVPGVHQASLFPVRPGASAALVDFRKRKLWAIEGAAQVLTSSNDQALLRRGSSFSLWKSGKEENVDLNAHSLAHILIQGGTVSIDAEVFLLDDELRSWTLPAAPLAITRAGYALVPKHTAKADSWPLGPFVLMGPPGSNQPQ